MNFFIFLFIVTAFGMDRRSDSIEVLEALTLTDDSSDDDTSSDEGSSESSLGPMAIANRNADRLVKIENDRVQTVTLFKNHVLGLVDAAAKPFHVNFKMTNQGCACSQSIADEKTLNALNLIVTSMLLVHNDHSYVEKIRDVADVSKAREKLSIPLSAMQSIEKLVDLLRTTTDDLRLDTIGAKLKNYFDHYTPSQSLLTKGTGYFNVSLMSATKCYELMLAIDYNREFFENYLRGFSLVREWMRNPRASQPQELRSIIGQIARSELHDPPRDFKKAEFERNVLALQQYYLSRKK